MANMQISYSIILQDRFSKIAEIINKSINKITESAKRADKHICNLNRSLLDLKKPRTTLNRLDKTFSSIASSMKKASDANSGLKKAFYTTQKAVDSVEKTVQSSSTKIVKSIRKLDKETSSPLKSVYSKLSGINHKMAQFGRTASKMSWELIYSSFALVFALKEAAQQVDSEALSMMRLNNAIVANHSYLSKLKSITEKYSNTTRFSSDDLLRSSASLARYTRNAKVAFGSLKPVMDLATGTGMSLDQATSAFITSITTKNNALLRQGIIIDKNLWGYQRLHAIIKKIKLRFAGQTEKAEGVGFGRTITAFNKIMDLIKKIEKTILPVINDIADAISGVVDSISKWVDKHKELTRSIGLFILGGIALVAVMASIGLVVTALSIMFGMLISPVSVIATVFIALGVYLVYLYKKFGWFRKSIKSVYQAFLDLSGLLNKSILYVFHKIDSVIKSIGSSIKSLNPFHKVSIKKHETMAVQHAINYVPNFASSGDLSRHETKVKMDINLNDPGGHVESVSTPQHHAAIKINRGTNMGHLSGGYT